MADSPNPPTHNVRPFEARQRRDRPALRVLAWLLIAPLLACLLGSLSLNLMGLEVQPASAYFGQPRLADQPIAAFEPGTSEALSGTTITIWFLKQQRFFSADTIFARELARGRLADGRLAYRISFDEAGFNRYMSYWFFPTDEALAEIVQGIRRPRIDFIDGGLVLYAEVLVGQDWKPAGLLYELDGSQAHLEFKGISVGEEAITAAPGSLIDSKLGGVIERLSNRALGDLTFIDESGSHLKISQIAIRDDEADVLATGP